MKGFQNRWLMYKKNQIQFLFLYRFDPALRLLKLHLPTVVNHSSDMMCLKEHVTVDSLTLDRFTSLGLNPTWDIADVFKNLGRSIIFIRRSVGNVLLTGCQTILSRKNNRSTLQNGTCQILSTLDLYLHKEQQHNFIITNNLIHQNQTIYTSLRLWVKKFLKKSRFSQRSEIFIKHVGNIFGNFSSKHWIIEIQIMIE